MDWLVLSAQPAFPAKRKLSSPNYASMAAQEAIHNPSQQLLNVHQKPSHQQQQQRQQQQHENQQQEQQQSHHLHHHQQQQQQQHRGGSGCSDPFRGKGPWTEAEDQELLMFVHTFGAKQWRKVAAVTRLKRDAQSCRLRWTSHLSPDANNQPFTEVEDQLLLTSVPCTGETKWASIATKMFPGRTGYQIQRRWHVLMNRARKTQPSAEDCVHAPPPRASDGLTAKLAEAESPGFAPAAAARSAGLTLTPSPIASQFGSPLPMLLTGRPHPSQAMSAIPATAALIPSTAPTLAGLASTLALGPTCMGVIGSTDVTNCSATSMPLQAYEVQTLRRAEASPRVHSPGIVGAADLACIASCSNHCAGDASLSPAASNRSSMQRIPSRISSSTESEVPESASPARKLPSLERVTSLHRNQSFSSCLVETGVNLELSLGLPGLEVEESPRKRSKLDHKCNAASKKDLAGTSVKAEVVSNLLSFPSACNQASGAPLNREQLAMRVLPTLLRASSTNLAAPQPGPQAGRPCLAPPLSCEQPRLDQTALVVKQQVEALFALGGLMAKLK